jgi:hypothetical protein
MLHAYLIAGAIACALGVKALLRNNGKKFRIKCAYLLRKRKAAYNAFEVLTSRREGLCVCRALPNGKEYQNTLILDENGITSHDLEKLLHYINNFIKAKNRVVLLDCMDHFIKENSFEEAVKFLHSLKDQIILNDSILLTTLELNACSRIEKSFVEQEMDKII